VVHLRHSNGEIERQRGTIAVIPKQADPSEQNRATVAAGGNEICFGKVANSRCRSISAFNTSSGRTDRQYDCNQSIL
jgi:hypothetical protein